MRRRNLNESECSAKGEKMGRTKVKEMKKIGDKIGVDGMGMMGLETYFGEVVGTTHEYYIIDLGKGTIIHQRFIIRLKTDYEIIKKIKSNKYENRSTRI